MPFLQFTHIVRQTFSCIYGTLSIGNDWGRHALSSPDAPALRKTLLPHYSDCDALRVVSNARARLHVIWNLHPGRRFGNDLPAALHDCTRAQRNGCLYRPAAHHPLGGRRPCIQKRLCKPTCNATVYTSTGLACIRWCCACGSGRILPRGHGGALRRMHHHMYRIVRYGIHPLIHYRIQAAPRKRRCRKPWPRCPPIAGLPGNRCFYGGHRARSSFTAYRNDVLAGVVGAPAVHRLWHRAAFHSAPRRMVRISLYELHAWVVYSKRVAHPGISMEPSPRFACRNHRLHRHGRALSWMHRS